MAEFLIYNKAHWMSVLSQQEVEAYIEKHPKFLEKYDARYQMGDVVEVRPDGYWTEAKAYNKSAFLLVTVPGLSFKDAKHYGEPLTKERIGQIWNEETQKDELHIFYDIIRKRKYNFGSVTDKQIFNGISEISVTEKTFG